MFEKLKSMLRMGDNIQTKTVGSVSANPYSTAATMHCYASGSYDNNYPAITRIAERFATTLPYAVDENGEKIEPAPAVIRALYNPNREMSAIRFFKTLAVMTLVHPNTYILVWRRNGRDVFPGGGITPENIAGFTFLESPRVEVENGKKVFYSYNTQERFTEDEVITLSLDVNPYGALAGYSPSVAAKKWSNIDDYIADFQAGYFKNGAIPAGEFIITAPSVAAYQDIVDKMKRYIQGAKNNNSVLYVHRPVSDTGAPMASSVEWVPFVQTNKDMSLHDLFEQAEKVRDMTFGVPAEIKGYLQNSNYASVSVAERVFDKYVVKPKLTQLWTDFTHELNRITGGLGCAISFDFDETVLAEENQLEAATTQMQFQTLTNALASGFTIDSAVAALGLPSDFLKLKEKTPEVTAPTEEAAQGDTPVSQLDTSTKAAGSRLKSKALEDNDEGVNRIETIIRYYEDGQVSDALNGLDFLANEVRAGRFAADMFEEIKKVMDMAGAAQYAKGRSQLLVASLPLDGATGYELTTELAGRYKDFLKNIALSFETQTADQIKVMLEQADYEGWDKEQISEQLRGMVDTDAWRIERLARSENHRAQGLASVDAMTELQKQTGVEFVKVWHVNPASNACAECMSMNGKRMPLDKPFISAEDNSFADIESCDAHPNCNCYLQYEIAGGEKSVKVVCPKCGRYMFESKGGTAQNVICANSKCKRHFDFKVMNGKVYSKDVTPEPEETQE